jgi:hypothetical protein
MVFDVKMEDFCWKARLVAGGLMTKAPATLTYASVVSRETVRLALTVAALNDIDVWAADVLNAYITAPCRKKIWTTLGPEFESDRGKKALVIRYSKSDWGAEYDGAEELIPGDAPKALGKSVLLRMFVDSDHAGDKKSRRSRTGFVILVNGGIIDWLSKKQSTIKTSVFGAEFCAMKHSIENLCSIRYKLRMMGVPIDGATRIFSDNMSVVTNLSKPESTLKKKSNSVCYHAVREAVVMLKSARAPALSLTVA